MAVAWAIYRRELMSLFLSPVAYVVLLVFQLINGVVFYFFLTYLDGRIEPLISSQYGAIPFWFLCMLVPPLLTMRTFAEEKRAGTYEMLVTSGVSEPTLIVAKFFASWSFFVFMWATILPLYGMLEYVGDLDWGVLLTVHLGLLLLGALYCGLGVLASTLTRNQLVAAIIAMVLNLFIFFLNYFRLYFGVGQFEVHYFNYISPLFHFSNDFAVGVFDFRYLFFYLSLTAFALFLASKVLERRRWR